MARQLTNDNKNSGEYAEFIDIEGEADDISDLQNDVDSQMAKIFAEFGGDPTDTGFEIFVKRIIPNRGELEHCFTCLPHELPIIERIRTEWGPGEYAIWIYKDKKIWKRRKLNIARALNKPTPPQDTLGGGGIKDVLAAMAANQEAQFQQMRAMMAPPPQPVNPMDQMQQTLALMQMFKSIMGDDSKTIDPMAQMRQTMEFAKDFAEMSGGGEGRSSTDILYKLVEGALPALLEGAKTETTHGVNNHPKPTASFNTPIPPTPTQRPAIPQPQPQPQPQENPEMLIKGVVKRELPKLIAMARVDKDASLYAEVVLDNIPDMFLDKYITFIGEDNCIDQLTALNPDVAQFRDWFTRFRQETINMITDDDDTAPLTDTDVINHTDDNVSADEKNSDNRNNSDAPSNT